jgi:hypothetical protein
MKTARKVQPKAGLRERAAGLKAAAEKVIRRQAADSVDDPIFAAIERNREGMRLRTAADQAAADERDPVLVGAREKAVQESWRRWRDEVLRTRPTTAEGAQALAQHALEWLREQGADSTDTVDYRKALELLASPTPGTASIREKLALKRTLGSMTIGQLAGLYGLTTHIAGLLWLASQQSTIGEGGAEIMDRETERFDKLRDRIAEELERRIPTSSHDAEQRASYLLQRAAELRDWAAAVKLCARTDANITRLRTED